MSIFGKKPNIAVRSISIAIPNHILHNMLIDKPFDHAHLLTLTFEDDNAMLDIRITSFNSDFYADKDGPELMSSSLTYKHARN